MAGILDPKQRVMDITLTKIGRLQMVKGEFNVKYVSFSDKGVEYVDNGDGVLEPITERLFFESFSIDGDEIIPEIDNAGDFLVDQSLPGTLQIKNGVLKTLNTTDQYTIVEPYSQVSTFCENTFNRFRKLEILNTVTDTNEFDVDKKYFKVQQGQGNSTLVDTSSILPIAIDPRFESQINMRYLPPVTTIDDTIVPIKSFNKWTSSNVDSSVLDEARLETIVADLETTMVARERITIGSENTKDYKNYSILGQMFVKKQDTLKKYVLIDAGEYFDYDNLPVCKIYHAGFISKELPSQEGLAITKFIREFSLVFHNGGITWQT